ncbi:hypothetical protein [Sporosarcina saromensis]|uniref:hypothetical protein n=1 Tax=Sporosarcina saromensis TaxID=359365 RepID=UPI00295E7C40|nr:hypothetical protein [Sporosarcina saromensis]
MYRKSFEQEEELIHAILKDGFALPMLTEQEPLEANELAGRSVRGLWSMVSVALEKYLLQVDISVILGDAFLMCVY